VTFWFFLTDPIDFNRDRNRKTFKAPPKAETSLGN